MGKFDDKGEIKVISACRCGYPVQVGTECWSCYEARTGKGAAHKTYLLNHLEDIGMGRKDGESKHDYAMRCREYCVKTMGRVGK